MPSRVASKSTRDDSTPTGSEESFVSAESATLSFHSGKEGQSHVGQSAAPAALRSSSPHRRTQKPTALANSPLPTSKPAHGVNDCYSNPSFIQSHTLPPSDLSTGGSYFTSQPGASGLEPRSPQNKRPPASRSSHGIETSSGPPPALSTQRSYNGEIPWRSPPPIVPRTLHALSSNPINTTHSIDSIVRLSQRTTNEGSGSNSSIVARTARSKSLENDGLMSTMAGKSNGNLASEDDRDSTLRMYGKQWEERRHDGNNGIREQSASSNEDLFLNLAKADSVSGDSNEASARRERQRSHVRSSSLEKQRGFRPSSSGRPSTSGASFAGQHVTPSRSHFYKSSFDETLYRSSEKDSLPSLRDLATGKRSYAASAHPLDQRSRINGSRTSFGIPRRDPPMQHQSPEAPPLSYGRRRSLRETSPGLGARSYMQPASSYEINSKHGLSHFPSQDSTVRAQEQAGGSFHPEGTESTVSTTAPSTVWDELDDLKSRLRKLELTGILPPSSNAAMSKVRGERPPTATTTSTTISSSPKRRHMDTLDPDLSTKQDLNIASFHPLLHSALAKVKPSLNPNLYKALEVTASDALGLVAMTNVVGPDQASVIGSVHGTDRRLQRTADSMCRSLTELCIALAEDTPETTAVNGMNRSGSEDTVQLSEATIREPRSFRVASLEPETRTSSRVMSRLEARRTSLLGSSPLNGRRESTPEARTPTSRLTPIASKIDRSPTVVRRNATSDHQVDGSSERRPPSRAMTEVGQIRSSPPTRAPREYTSQHPMPNQLQSQRSPSVQSSLPMRKSYFSSASQSPITPSVQPRTRSLLDRSTPPSSADNARLAEARQRRIASLGQHSSASQSRVGLSSARLQQSQPEQ